MEARGFKANQDPDKRKLGYAIDDALDVLRDSAERNSPPGVRDRLRQINTGYAVFTRIQDAAARRLTSGGKISPTDLLAAVKKGDHTVRKGAFARGDALLQQFAEDASEVLTPVMSDSGTTERALWLGTEAAGGLMGHAAGGIPGMAAGITMPLATNALARVGLARAASRSPVNYLRAVDRRVSPLVPHRVVGAVGGNALASGNNQ
jgi:hypothetical protein